MRVRVYALTKYEVWLCTGKMLGGSFKPAISSPLTPRNDPTNFSRDDERN